MPTTIEYKLDWKNVGDRIQYTEETNYTFTDQEIDRETGLMYYNARYYNPSLGRFLQEDPVYNGNPYIYVSNNPLKYTDPDGKRRRVQDAERQNLRRQWQRTNEKIRARNNFKSNLFKDFQRYFNYGQFAAEEIKYMKSTVNTQVDRLNQRDLDMMYRREGIYRKNKARRARGYVANVSYGKTISQIKFEMRLNRVAKMIHENDSQENIEKQITLLTKNNPGMNSLFGAMVEGIESKSKVLRHEKGVPEMTSDFIEKLISSGEQSVELDEQYDNLFESSCSDFAGCSSVNLMKYQIMKYLKYYDLAFGE
jgi:RHS repeat-associated protein